MTKDYYNILGVTESNTIDEIKLAYRKLARKWHPDVAGNSEGAIQKFKEINEAYGILSNSVKKEEYDRARSFYTYAQAKQKGQNSSDEIKKTDQNKKTSFQFDWNDLLKKTTFKQHDTKEKKNTYPQKGKDINTDIEISVFEAVTGTSKIINLMQTKICPQCQGRKPINGTVCKACNGKGEINEYKKFRVNIPSGISNGSKIRLANEGEIGLNGGKNGDLYITVYVNEKLNYKTEGLNIYKTITIEPYKAVLGGELKIMTLNGQVSIKLLPNTQNGQKIRLTKCGLVQSDNVGDMIITIEIKIPNNISEEEIKLYQKLEKIASTKPREEF